MASARTIRPRSMGGLSDPALHLASMASNRFDRSADFLKKRFRRRIYLLVSAVIYIRANPKRIVKNLNDVLHFYAIWQRSFIHYCQRTICIASFCHKKLLPKEDFLSFKHLINLVSRWGWSFSRRFLNSLTAASRSSSLIWRQESFSWGQGVQIGRIFDYWAIVNFGPFF
jgi:hypothetical protein